jgi:hypothetical protein
MQLSAQRWWPFHTGSHVVHRSLDDPSGTPRHGRVEETVGDSLIIARFDDQQVVGYDRRELERLIMIPVPIMLTPRHFLRVVAHGMLELRQAAGDLWRRLAGLRIV